MPDRLASKVAVVTGAGQGIGRGVAFALSEDGASVVLGGRTESKLKAVQTEVTARGGNATVAVGDVSEATSTKRMIETAIASYGRLDILVNCAQDLSLYKPFDQTTVEDIDLAFSTGPLGAFFAMQNAYPHLAVRGGSVVNFGSAFGVQGEPGYSSYAIAKEATRGLSRVAAREWGKDGIRVNVLCPIALSTAAEEYFAERPEEYEMFVALSPLGRLGDPYRDIGRTVAALVSEDMSYVTGATLMVDGGRVIL